MRVMKWTTTYGRVIYEVWDDKDKSIVQLTAFGEIELAAGSTPKKLPIIIRALEALHKELLTNDAALLDF